MKNNNIIIVIGGGPSGMMAAIKAAESGKDVTLIEKNSELGKKLLLTGKGRCNLTNNTDLDSFIKRFSGNGQFLRDAFKAFSNLDLIDFFESRGVKLKVERQQRVFPESDKAIDILDVLRQALKENKVKILYNREFSDIIIDDNKVAGIKIRGEKDISCSSVILCTGGISYASTGSSGEGLRIAQRLGHKIVDLRPGLIGLMTKDKYPKLLQGLALKNIRITFSNGKKKIASEIGELMFTDFGISGPLVLALSGQVVDWLREYKKVTAFIDLKPALSSAQIDTKFLREFKANPKKSIQCFLRSMLPQRLIDVFLEKTDIEGEKTVSQITLQERKKLLILFKALEVEISKPRPINMAMITKGGVSLKEINPKTMESRLIEGLYFAGEIIDADADTGGFNLQAAFSTGYLAGESAAK
jgi:hypothetical protein